MPLVNFNGAKVAVPAAIWVRAVGVTPIPNLPLASKVNLVALPVPNNIPPEEGFKYAVLTPI